MSFYQNTTSCHCSNCGGSGHTFRICVEPVSSYGALVFRWVSNNPQWTPFSEFCKDTSSPIGITNIVPQILMIQRKDSLGFMDIMRGKYKINEPDYIKKQLRGMTVIERTKLLNDDFEDIWHNLWGSDIESSQRYAHDRLLSKQKLAELKAGVELPSGEKYSLSDLLRQEPAIYTTPEWGFPKGRRDPYETDIQCAFRELQEETSITEEELWKVINVAPFIEQFYGSNNIHYRHTYYLAQYIDHRDISFNSLNSEMTREIGNLAWKTLDEAILLLRPENIEKRGILVQLAALLRNFYPVFRDEVIGVKITPPDRLKDVTENTAEEQQDQYVFSQRFRRGGTMEARMERPTRFFGTRQTHRRISDIRVSNQSQNTEGTRHWSKSAGTGGTSVSGYRRHIVPLETSTEEGVQRNTTD
jgi:8-oxo-dGTP pyrophosphatase MutT (NUDIX family)